MAKPEPEELGPCDRVFIVLTAIAVLFMCVLGVVCMYAAIRRDSPPYFVLGSIFVSPFVYMTVVYTYACVQYCRRRRSGHQVLA
jgi:hypothetical protein